MDAGFGTVETRENAVWYGMSTLTSEAQDVDTALELAGLDWEVEKRPLAYRNSAKGHTRIPSQHALVRADTDTFFGTCSDKYALFQNREIFSFVDNLVHGGAKIDSAGEQHGGKKVFIVAKMPDHISVAGEDEHELYLFIRSGHDGGGSLQVKVTPIRMRCRNMIPLITRTAKRSWSLWHTSTMEGKLEDARAELTLQLTADYRDEFEQEVQRMIDTPMTDRALREAFESVVVESPRREQKVERVLEIRHGSPTINEEYRGTAWGAMNAVSEYYDWLRPVRNNHARLTTSLDGQGRRVRDAVQDRMRELVSA